MRIQNLKGTCRDRDVYVIGTGPSMQTCPSSFFAGKVTIGLNQAWKYLATTYSLTVHPELLDEYFALKDEAPATRWVVKKKPPREDLQLDDPTHYVFHTKEDLAVIREQPDDVLYIGRGVQQTAMDLAARMGARAIVLVGVDMCALGGQHHGHDQHTRFLGVPPERVYAEYRKFTAKARKVIREAHGIPVLTLGPLLGAGHHEEDYQRLRLELGLKKLPRAKDISPYKRKSPKL